MKAMASKGPRPAYVHPSEMRIFRRVAELRSIPEAAKEFGLPQRVVSGAVNVVLRFLRAKDIDDALSIIERAMSRPDPLDRAFDFSNAKRGFHYDAARGPSNIVKLDSDVHKAFPDSISVNAALRSWMKRQDSGARKSA